MNNSPSTYDNASETLCGELLLLAEWKLLQYVFACFFMLMNLVSYGQEIGNDLSKNDSLEYLRLKQDITNESLITMWNLM